MIRTTIRFDENLFKDARKEAIDERVPFSQIVNEALYLYLRLGKTKRTGYKKVNTTDFILKLTDYRLKDGPKDLAKKHDKYTWE